LIWNPFPFIRYNPSVRWFVPFKGLVFLRCRRVNQRKETSRRLTRPSRKVGTNRERSRPLTNRQPKIDPLVSRVGVFDHPHATPWKIKDITDIHRPVAWIKRDSKKFIGRIGPYGKYRIPYIDFLGRNTGEHLYDWVTTLEGFSTSYVATIVKRLLVHIWSLDISRKKKRGYRALCTRIAALTFISGKNYLIERFKALLTKRGCSKIINSMIRKFATKLDDDKWFVYRHISSQIKWIDLRVQSKTGPRDKSKIHGSLASQAEKLGRDSSVTFGRIYQALNQILLRTGLYV